MIGLKSLVILVSLLTSVAFGTFEYTSPLDDLNSDFLITEGVITGMVSVTDGTALWQNSELSGFGRIEGATLTDGIFTVSGGVISAGTWQGNTVQVPYGGTGAIALTDGGILLGSGTSAITALGVASNGQIPIGDGVTDPVLATLTGTTAEIEITNGAGSIIIGLPDDLIITGDVNIVGELEIGDVNIYGGLTVGENVDIAGNLTVDGTIINTDFTTLTDNSMANALHRHSELSASDGTPDQALIVDATGDVGIGTASPDSVLHIKASVPGIVGNDYAGQLIIQSPTNDVNTGVVITGYKSDVSGDPDVQLWYLGSSSSSDENIIFLNRRNANLALGTNDTHRITILGNGNVGINVTDPDAKLEVVGTLHVSDAATFDAIVNIAGNLLAAKAGFGSTTSILSTAIVNIDGSLSADDATGLNVDFTSSGIGNPAAITAKITVDTASPSGTAGLNILTTELVSGGTVTQNIGLLIDDQRGIATDLGELNNLAIGTSGGNVIILDGFVGIGTSTNDPTVELEVVGDIITNSIIFAEDGVNNFIDDFRSFGNARLLIHGEDQIRFSISDPGRDIAFDSTSFRPLDADDLVLNLGTGASPWNDLFLGGSIDIQGDNETITLGVGDDLIISSDGTNGVLTGKVLISSDLTVDSPTFHVDAADNAVGIGTVTPSANADLTLEGGVLNFKETTTPTADTDYGKLYTKSTNELFFQDGDGTEHLLHGDSFSVIWFHGTSTVEVNIPVQDAFAIIDSFTVVGKEDDLSNAVGDFSANTITISSGSGGEYKITYHGSITATGGADKEMIFVFGITLATPLDITNVTDNTITPIVITSTAHGLENGDMVQIVGVLGNTAANGSFILANKADDTFQIVALDGNPTTGNGDYNEGSPTGDVTIEYPGQMVVHRMVRGADLGAMSATGIHELDGSDVVSLYVANVSGTTNLTVAAISLGLDRIGD